MDEQTAGKPKKLTAKEKMFVAAYCGKCFLNATAAARAAGYSDPNADGSSIANRPHVRAAIEVKLAEYNAGSQEVLRFLADVLAGTSAYIKPSADGQFGSYDVQQMVEDGKGHLIKGFKEIPSKFGVVQVVEVQDPMQAATVLARILGLDKGSGAMAGVEVTVKVLRGVSMDDL